MIFNDGYMIKAGNPCRDYIDKATRHVLLRQGCVGIKIEIMVPHDPRGKAGPKKPMPDFVEVFEPKDDVVVAAPVKGRLAQRSQCRTLSRFSSQRTTLSLLPQSREARNRIFHLSFIYRSSGHRSKLCCI